MTPLYASAAPYDRRKCPVSRSQNTVKSVRGIGSK
ncbi:hypothetical protein MPLA_2130148 [Mesorhizobium sp. ORS 3359]|nr:hypothetical protein MPLA_2130148 [Mesorhizobium sp. ORS 3359]